MYTSLVNIREQRSVYKKKFFLMLLSTEGRTTVWWNNLYLQL